MDLSGWPPWTIHPPMFLLLLFDLLYSSVGFSDPSLALPHPSFLETSYVYELMHYGDWIYSVFLADNDMLWGLSSGTSTPSSPAASLDFVREWWSLKDETAHTGKWGERLWRAVNVGVEGKALSGTLLGSSYKRFTWILIPMMMSYKGMVSLGPFWG